MTKEAMTLALEALEGSIAITMAKIDLRNKAIKALEEALAKQEQPTVRTGNCLRVGVCASEGHKIQAKQEQGEPVGWMDKHFTCDLYKNKPELDVVPLYTTPPQSEARGLSQQPAPQRSEDTTQKKPWVGLTDDDISDMWHNCKPYYDEDDFAKAIEAKLKEKNT